MCNCILMFSIRGLQWVLLLTFLFCLYPNTRAVSCAKLDMNGPCWFVMLILFKQFPQNQTSNYLLNHGLHITQYLNNTALNMEVSLKCHNNGQELQFSWVYILKLANLPWCVLSLHWIACFFNDLMHQKALQDLFFLIPGSLKLPIHRSARPWCLTLTNKT